MVKVSTPKYRHILKYDICQYKFVMTVYVIFFIAYLLLVFNI